MVNMLGSRRFLLVVLLAGGVFAVVVGCASSRRHEEQAGAAPANGTVAAAPPIESTRRVTVGARILEVTPTHKRHQSYIFEAVPDEPSPADATARYVFELYQDFGGMRLLAALAVDFRELEESGHWTSEGGSLIDLELVVTEQPSAVVRSGYRSVPTPNANVLAWRVKGEEWQRAGPKP
jgi:hypothetical protein